MIINTKQFWGWWTAELKTWFTNKFSALTSVVAKDATVAKEATLTSTRTTLQNAIAALQGNDTTATLTAIKTIVSALENGLTAADKTWLQQQFAAIDLSSITSRLDNNTYGLNALRTLILAIPTTPISDYAKREDVKDGNDTAISVSKTIKTSTDKIGTPTSATNNTLFKAIENIQLPSGIATEANATANKNAIISNDKTTRNILVHHIHKDDSDYPTCVSDGSLWYYYDKVGVNESLEGYVKYTSLNSGSIFFKSEDGVEVGSTIYLEETFETQMGTLTQVEDDLLAKEATSTAIKTSTDKIGSGSTGRPQTLFGAIENVQVDTSTLATKTTQDAQTGQLTTLQQRLGISGEVVETLQAALQGNDTSATLAALKTLIAAIPTTQISGYALQGTNPNINLTTMNEKLDASYATNAQVVEAIEDYLTPYIPINS